MKVTFWRLFWVFWFELQKYPKKIIYYLLVCFSQILPCFAFSQFCKSCACFFFAKTFCQSWETVALVENIYFQQRQIILLWVLTTLISLWWVSYAESFQVCEGRWWKKIRECQALKLGDAPMHPQEIFKETQASKLGDAPVHPLLHQQSSVRPSPCYIFIASYVMCYAWSVLLLLFSLFSFACCS